MIHSTFNHRNLTGPVFSLVDFIYIFPISEYWPKSSVAKAPNAISENLVQSLDNNL